MSSAAGITIRLRTRDGTFRFQVNPSSDISELWAHAITLSNRDSVSLCTLNGVSFPRSGMSIRSLNIGHGDLVRVDYEANAPKPNNVSKSTSTDPPIRTALAHLDPLDVLLAKEIGLIQRKKDPRFCRHGDRGMCEYCSPLEPYDSQYLEDRKIKHLSFHAYLRKLTSSSTRQSGDALVHPLNPPSCKVLIPCSNAHAPWPEGICSKCQPSALTLARQSFRMIDHVEFDGPHLINTLLSAWRSSGCQRFAYMYGRYQPYPLVPLGIKAVVSVLYEPPQSNASDGLALDHVIGTPASSNHAVTALDSADNAAHLVGLVRLGMIFTDLTDDGSGLGTVECKRHSKSFFLTGPEVRLAAHMQKQHPLRTDLSPTGHFGSRFVTCVVSGNSDGGIEVEAWQVSEQAVALVDADLVSPCTVPDKLILKPSTSLLYVPDVIFQERNEYGSLVMHRAEPAFPVDYLLVNVTHGFPTPPNEMFPSSKYPIANRALLGGQIQSETSLANAVHSTVGFDKIDPDFGLFEHITRTGLVPSDQLQGLAHALTELKGTGVPSTPAWTTLASILNPTQQAAITDSSARPPGSLAWDCAHCTFHNQSDVIDCEMCGLPRV